jgi:hypothetical protein
MDKRDRILNDYWEANETRRLHLYLEYRGLRPEFTKINREGFQMRRRSPILGKILEKWEGTRFHASCLKAFRACQGRA